MRFYLKIFWKKKNILNKINKNFGSEAYNELFGKEINYIRIIQNTNNTKVKFNITSIKMSFFEVILIMCNSFQVLAPLSNEQVIFLNKTIFDPFYSLNNKVKYYF